MRDEQKVMKDFHRKFGFSIDDRVSPELLACREKLMREELFALDVLIKNR